MKVIDKVRDVIEFIGATDVSEMCWEKDGLRIDLRREVTIPAVQRKSSEVTIEDNEKAEPGDTGTQITALMVGTFYTTHPVSQQIYVKKGTQINAGQVVGVIEAMKVYREVHAPVNAKIVDILVADGQPVMYAQELIEIEEI